MPEVGKLIPVDEDQIPNIEQLAGTYRPNQRFIATTGGQQPLLQPGGTPQFPVMSQPSGGLATTAGSINQPATTTPPATTNTQNFTQSVQEIYRQLMQSPFYRAQIGQLLAQQGMTTPALAAAQGQAGTMRTGVGQAQGTLQGVAGQLKAAQLSGDLYGEAMQYAAPLTMQETDIAAKKDLQETEIEFRKWLNTADYQQQLVFANMSYQQQRQLMVFANDLKKQLMRYEKDLNDEGFWGSFFGKLLSGFASFIPFL